MGIPFKKNNNLKTQISCVGYYTNDKGQNMNKKAKNVLEQSEEIKDKNFMDSLKSNEELRKVLFKAKNISTTLMTNIVPQLATSIKSVVAEMMSNKNITNLKDWNFLNNNIKQCFITGLFFRKNDCLNVHQDYKFRSNIN